MTCHIRDPYNKRRTLCGRLTHKYQIAEDRRRMGAKFPRWTVPGFGEHEVPISDVCEDCRRKVRSFVT